ncbi:MAG TPA: hypothetical protein HA232_02365 [Methanocellales archaeon]|jgi:hypothetical protein|nr:hypothetical protein [Methanocellales archaeon]
MDTNDYKKTTVMLPLNILRGLRQYIVNHDLTSHDQSRVIAAALRIFLETSGIEIDQNIITTQSEELQQKSTIVKSAGIDVPPALQEALKTRVLEINQDMAVAKRKVLQEELSNEYRTLIAQQEKLKELIARHEDIQQELREANEITQTPLFEKEKIDPDTDKTTLKPEKSKVLHEAI